MEDCNDIRSKEPVKKVPNRSRQDAHPLCLLQSDIFLYEPRDLHKTIEMGETVTKTTMKFMVLRTYITKRKGDSLKIKSAPEQCARDF